MIPRSAQSGKKDDPAGKRKDGRNLIEEWLKQKNSKRAKYVWKKDQFDNVNPRFTDHLLGKKNHVILKFSTVYEPNFISMVFICFYVS